MLSSPVVDIPDALEPAVYTFDMAPLPPSGPPPSVTAEPPGPPPLEGRETGVGPASDASLALSVDQTTSSAPGVSSQSVWVVPAGLASYAPVAASRGCELVGWNAAQYTKHVCCSTVLALCKWFDFECPRKCQT